MTGSKMKIWKQDPTVQPIGIRTTFVHTEIKDGPKDAFIQIGGIAAVRANVDRNFLFDPAANPNEFDSVHTFTVVRQVLTMYKRVLKRTQRDIEFKWQWGSKPIKVYPHAGLDQNAYYDRSKRELRFFYFHPDSSESNPLVYTCRSFDIVAHETGHAILDALKPGFFESWHPQTGGLHESFGDLTAIFTMLAQLDQCEAIIAESKADLHTKTFFSAVAEQFGEALFGRTTGLRNADNDLKLSEVTNEVHDISQVFTGAVYDILADIFDDYVKFDEYDPAETLFRVGKHMTSLVFLTVLEVSEKDVTYSELAQKMIDLEPEEKWKTFVRDRFAEREVLPDTQSMAALQPVEMDLAHCGGTLTHPDQLKRFKKAIKKARKRQK